MLTPQPPRESIIPPTPSRRRPSQYEINEYLAIEMEAERRKMRALGIYEPLPFQEEYHQCKARECILQKGNRAGGSLSGFAEDARAVLGLDPYDKYPKVDGTLVCLGWGEQHIGRVIHKYLFRAGAFRIIRDETTEEWRVYKPWQDEHRKDESKPAPPLIPASRVVNKIAWVKRAEYIFSQVELDTGWTIYACNSNGDANHLQGIDVNLYHIDEDVAQSRWYDEAVARTGMTRGLIRWTCMPHAKTDDIVNMIQRAEDEQVKELPLTVCIRASMFDNPYFPKDTREQNIQIWKSQGEDVYRKRAFGELTIGSIKMYPTFDKRLHNAKLDVPADEIDVGTDSEKQRNKIRKTLFDRGGEPPDDWTRYVSVDPGHTVAAATLWCVPPPSEGDFRIIYDEVYLREADAPKFAKALSPKVRNRVFEEFIIDAHGARLRELGSGITPRQQYEKAFEAEGILSQKRGARFKSGSDNIVGRETKLREWLSVRPVLGTTKLMIISENCPNTVREFERFKKKTVTIGGQEVATDDGNRRSGTHAVETVEYVAADGIPYVKPKITRRQETHVHRILRGRQMRAAQRRARRGALGFHRQLGPQGASAE
jgi:hypothetical protein